MKNKVWQKIIACLLTFVLIFTSVNPMLLFAYAADDNITLTPTATSDTIITPTPAPEVTPADQPTPTITSNDIAITLTPEIAATAAPIVTPEPTPTQFPSQWTFEKIELNKEYIAPQNNGVKLTFTKLPNIAGSIKIEEITLTKEQIQQTGSLSDKAYDITSNMTDGAFQYDLTLPIPLTAQGQTIEIKSAETIDEVVTNAETIDEPKEVKSETITITGLDHFTVFVLVNDIDTDNPDSLGDSDDVANGVAVESLGDTWAGQGNPDTTHEASADLNVRSQSGGNNQRAFVNFDLSSIPVGAVITKATLRLFLYDAPGTTRTYEAHRIAEGWNQNTLTWNFQPAVAEASSSSVTTGTSDNVWREWDVTDDVSNYVLDGQPLFGWRIKDSSEDSGTSYQGQFRSGDYSTVLKRPQLVVDFAEAGQENTYQNPTQEAAAAGDGFETNPGNALTDANGDASNINGTGESHLFYGYDFTGIPVGAVINGIEVRADWRLDATAGTNSLSVELSYDGGVSWTDAKTDITETDKQHISSLGAVNDTWGREWNLSDFTDDNFRVRVTTNSTDGSRDFYLDWIPVRVSYTPDSTAPTDPADVASSSHSVDTPTSNSTIDMTWTAAGTLPGATDDGSGVDGYSYDFTAGAEDTPDESEDAEEDATGTTSDSLADGSWYFHLRTVDNAGNWTATVHAGPYVIDTTPPSEPGTPTTTTPTNSSSQTWDWLASIDPSGILQYLWQVTGGPSGTTTDIFTDTSLGEGIWDFFVKAQDNAGNESGESQGTVTVDQTAPTVTAVETMDENGNGNIDALKLTFSENINDDLLDLGNGGDGWDIPDPIGEEQIGTGDADNDEILILTFGEGPTPDTGNTPTVTYTPTGGPGSTHDLAGNELGAYEGVADDKAKPVLLSAVTKDWDADGEIDTIELTFSENINDSLLAVGADGWDVDNYSGESISSGGGLNDNTLFLTFFESGTQDTGTTPTVSYVQGGDETSTHDLAGNELNSDTWSTTDNAAPISSITDPLADSIHNSFITISGSSSDADILGDTDTVNYTRLYSRLGDGEWTEISDSQRDNELGEEPFAWTFDWTPEEDGTYDIMAEATDTAGNTEESPVVNNVTYDTTDPDTPVATPPAGDYTADQSVELSSSDSLSGLASIYYTTDDTEPSNTNGTLYSDPIDIGVDTTLKAIAYDDAGNASGIMSATYGIAPVISAESTASINDASLTVTWTTDDPATSRVIYDTVSHAVLGAAPNYGYANSTIEDSTKVTSHSVGISGLSASTTYFYRTVSHGSPEAVGSEQTFSTAAATAVSSNSSGGTGAGDGLSDGLGCASHDCSNTANVSQGQVLGTFTWPTALAVFTTSGTEQEVFGATTSPDVTPTPEKSGEVLAGETPFVESKSTLLKTAFETIIILLIIGSFGYWFSRRRKKI